MSTIDDDQLNDDKIEPYISENSRENARIMMFQSLSKKKSVIRRLHLLFEAYSGATECSISISDCTISTHYTFLASTIALDNDNPF